MNRYLNILKKSIRIGLSVSIFVILISCFIVIKFGNLKSENYNDFSTIFIWYSIMFTIWTLFISFIILFIIVFYLIRKKENILENISKEIFIFCAGLLSIFALTIVIKFAK